MSEKRPHPGLLIDSLKLGDWVIMVIITLLRNG